MAASRRVTVVAGVAGLLAIGTWVAVLPDVLSTSTAVWITLAIALGAFVAAKFNRHADLPDSVKLH